MQEGIYHHSAGYDDHHNKCDGADLLYDIVHVFHLYLFYHNSEDIA